MKTKLKPGIILSCILLLFTVLLTGCSKDEDVVNDTVLCNTFLECNDETKWKQVFLEDGIESAHMYLKINNNLSNPFENWLNFTPNDCHEHMKISDHQIEIIENLKDEFRVKIIWQEEDWQQDEFEIWTFTMQDDLLKLVTQYFEEVITFYFDNTSDDIGNLEDCVD